MNKHLFTEGLKGHLVHEVEYSFRMLNRNADAEVVIEQNEINYVITELSSANVNIFSLNTELLNIIKVTDWYLLQLKNRPGPVSSYHYYSSGGTPDVTDYRLSILGFKKYTGDYGIIRIEPNDMDHNNFFVKLVSHLFTSHDLVIHGHERFTSKYRIFATEKEAANSILSDWLLNTMCNFDNLHISITKGYLVIYSPTLDNNSTVAILKILEMLVL